MEDITERIGIILNEEETENKDVTIPYSYLKSASSSLNDAYAKIRKVDSYLYKQKAGKDFTKNDKIRHKEIESILSQFNELISRFNTIK